MTAFPAYKGTRAAIDAASLLGKRLSLGKTAKELAEELEIALTKEITVHFTVTYDLTIEVGLDEEVDESDFNVDMNYNGDGEVTNEESDWSDIEIEEA